MRGVGMVELPGAVRHKNGQDVRLHGSDAAVSLPRAPKVGVRGRYHYLPQPARQANPPCANHWPEA